MSRWVLLRLCHIAFAHRLRQVFISYALMEISTLGGGEDEDGNVIEGDPGDPMFARAILERGYKDLRNKGEKEEVRHLRQSDYFGLTTGTARTSP